MKQILRKLSIAALALTGALIVGCTGFDIVPSWLDETTAVIPGSTGDPVTLTTTIGIDASPATKALDADGKKTFTAGEKVALIYTKSDGTTKAISEYSIQSEDISNGGKNAKLSFSLDDPKAGNVTLVYPASLASTTAADGIDMTQLQNNQDGTLTTLSANFDAATATKDMTISGETAILPTSIALTNPLTIGAFTITDKDESSADVTSAITQLIINDGTNAYTINRAAAAGPIYVAMLPVTSDKTITLTAASSAHHYLKTVTGKALAANNLYSISVDMPQDMLYEPLTIVTTVDNTQICVRNTAVTSDYAPGVIKYTINGGKEETIRFDDYMSSYTIIDIPNANSIVRFFGDNATYHLPSIDPSYKGSYIFVDKDCYVYGNIMSLIRSTGFYAETALIRDHTFDGLFYKEDISEYNKLKNHPSKALLLPATTLTKSCYYSMFSGCAGLTTAPALPATTLTAYCYSNMFSYCTGLTTAPALPAPTLAEGCYYSMFHGCTSLATAPALPAETLAESCYMYMFDGCTELTTAPALPAGTMKNECYCQMFYGCTKLTTAPALQATNLADGCYNGMFAGCAKLTAAPALPATILADLCYNYMFAGCKSLTTAPVLPAETLVKSCYCDMFKGCTKLSSVTCLAQTITADYCTSNWLYNAGTDSGITSRKFFTPASTAWASPSVSGIPSGWTRVSTTSVNLSSINNDYVAQNGDILTGTLSPDYKLTVPAGATVMLAGMTHHAGQYVSGIECQGSATINLVEGTTNDLTHGHESAYCGIIALAGTLTIDGTGTLVASGGWNSAGIGGYNSGNNNKAHIVIDGGNITATGGIGGAGIGARLQSSIGDITINGGNVTATGGTNAAGIGCGYRQGNSSSCGNITFNGGTVVVNAGANSGWGVGLDSRHDSHYNCGDIKFVGGNVTVNGEIATKSPYGIYYGEEKQEFTRITPSAQSPFVYPIPATP